MLPHLIHNTLVQFGLRHCDGSGATNVFDALGVNGYGQRANFVDRSDVGLSLNVRVCRSLLGEVGRCRIASIASGRLNDPVKTSNGRIKKCLKFLLRLLERISLKAL